MNNNENEEDNFQNLNINESLEFNNKKLLISGGISPERVINKEYLSSFGDFYKCNICFKIMVNPKDCEECGHSYCNECISMLNCPFGCKKKSIKNTSIGIINLLKNLKFKCDNKGCTSIIPYEQVKQHDSICEYKKVFCTNKKCKKKIIKKDLENHIKNECKYTLIKCQFCKSEYVRKELIEHEKLCKLTLEFIEKYKKGNNKIDFDNNSLNSVNSINNEIKLDEKYFNKFISNLSNNVAKIIKENKIIKQKEINNTDFNKSKKNVINNKDTKDNKDVKDNNDISKESMAQIEEDDLIDIIKKALEEKLKERVYKFDINISEFLQNLSSIKGCVCKLNTIEEVEESDEEDNDDDTKNKNKSINLIKDNLKKFIDEIELKIKLNIIQLKSAILNLYETHSKNNNYILLNNINIEKPLNEFAVQIKNCIQETKNMISNIYSQLKESKIIVLNNYGNKNNNSQKIIEQINSIFQEIFEKNKMDNISNELNIKLKDKYNEIYEEKNKLIKEEINKSLDEQKNIINSEINEINKEIESIKEIITTVKDLIINQSQNISNNINNFSKSNIINEFNYNKNFFRPRIKSVKTIQPNNINKNINKQKKFNSTISHLPIINPIKEIEIEKSERSYSSASLYFNDSVKLNELNKDNNNNLLKMINKVENKIKIIINNIENIPTQVEYCMFEDIKLYFQNLKKLIDMNLEEKINNKFRLKFCSECNKVESFYCFQKCFNCSDEFCLHGIILCRNCKEFLCKKCYTKKHKCNLISS